MPTNIFVLDPSRLHILNGIDRNPYIHGRLVNFKEFSYSLLNRDRNIEDRWFLNLIILDSDPEQMKQQ